MTRATTMLAAVVALSAASCDADPCNEAARCPGFVVPVGERDGKVSWGGATDLIMTVNGDRTPVPIVGGGAVFTAEDTSCTLGCRFILKDLHFEFGRIVLGSQYDEISIDGLSIGLAEPIDVIDVIPAGTPTRGCATVEGEPVHAGGRLPEDAKLGIDTLSSVFTFNGRMTFPFRAAAGDECLDFELEISGFPSARIPWDENPLCAGIDDCALEQSGAE